MLCRPNYLTHGSATRSLSRIVRCITTTTVPFRDVQQTPPNTPVRKILRERPPRLVDELAVQAPHTGYIKVFNLKSPHNKNAISIQLQFELDKKIRRVHDSVSEEVAQSRSGQHGAPLGLGPRAVIIGSEVDGVFCAGADLKERKAMTAEEVREFLYRLRGTFNILQRLHIPTISAVSSLALGGGLELALATDFRVFTPATLVGLPETRLGIIPGAGGIPRLHKLLGTTKAMDLILTGRRVDGEEALRIGLCDRLCGPSLKEIEKKGITDTELREHAMSGALKMAEEICAGGPATMEPIMQLMKHPIREGDEENAYDMVLKTNDREEALKAFAEKRKAVFTGT